MRRAMDKPCIEACFPKASLIRAQTGFHFGQPSACRSLGFVPRWTTGIGSPPAPFMACRGDPEEVSSQTSAVVLASEAWRKGGGGQHPVGSDAAALQLAFGEPVKMH